MVTDEEHLNLKLDFINHLIECGWHHKRIIAKFGIKPHEDDPLFENYVKLSLKFGTEKKLANAFEISNRKVNKLIKGIREKQSKNN